MVLGCKISNSVAKHKKKSRKKWWLFGSSIKYGNIVYQVWKHRGGVGCRQRFYLNISLMPPMDPMRLVAS